MLATLAGLILVVIGLLVTLVGGFLAFFGGRLFETPFESGGGVDAIARGFNAFGAIVLMIGILHLLSGIFVWAHRSWARYPGIVLGALGVLLGIAGLPGGAGQGATRSDRSRRVP